MFYVPWAYFWRKLCHFSLPNLFLLIFGKAGAFRVSQLCYKLIILLYSLECPFIESDYINSLFAFI
jgi:hypothetical protein